MRRPSYSSTTSSHLTSSKKRLFSTTRNRLGDSVSNPKNPSSRQKKPAQLQGQSSVAGQPEVWEQQGRAKAGLTLCKMTGENSGVKRGIWSQLSDSCLGPATRSSLTASTPFCRSWASLTRGSPSPNGYRGAAWTPWTKFSPSWSERPFSLLKRNKSKNRNNRPTYSISVNFESI